MSDPDAADGRSAPDASPATEDSPKLLSPRPAATPLPAMPAAAPAPTPAPSPGAEPPTPAGTRSASSTSGRRNRRRRKPAGGPAAASTNGGVDDDKLPDDLPERHRENRPSAEAAERALVRRPQIGDSMPAPPVPAEPVQGAARPGRSSGRTPRAGANSAVDADRPGDGSTTSPRRRRRRGGRGRSGASSGSGRAAANGDETRSGARVVNGHVAPQPVRANVEDEPVELDDDQLQRRRGRERKGQPVGRYLMAVHVRPDAAQIAVLEGRSLIEFYVSRPTDDVAQIHGNIYLGRVQNVLPGMEAAFVDIGTPKNAVLYRGDTRYDPEDIEEKGEPRIEQILKNRQVILCQVTKNPIGHKGARLTQEVSLPGRFVVLIPNSPTYGISKRLPDNERKRLRNVLDKVKPAEHGLIVRTAAEGVTAEEVQRDVLRLVDQWDQIATLAAKAQAPALLYREPDMALRVIREEFNKEYRKVVIDDSAIHDEVRDYVAGISPALADRVEHFDIDAEPLPLFERFHVHEQLHKALDRKVWLASGGSLIIEHTEALTVIDVNTGKNVGTSSLEETVYRNNLEAAEEIARQLRLRDVGGIIVIDFVDMEVRKNRDHVIRTFRDALARDKTRTQVFDISELGLVEMTRKRIGEGLLESFSSQCPACEGRGVVFDRGLLGGGLADSQAGS